jgi:hypothetical protein
MQLVHRWEELQEKDREVPSDQGGYNESMESDSTDSDSGPELDPQPIPQPILRPTPWPTPMPHPRIRVRYHPPSSVLTDAL